MGSIYLVWLCLIGDKCLVFMIITSRRLLTTLSALLDLNQAWKDLEESIRRSLARRLIEVTEAVVATRLLAPEDESASFVTSNICKSF